MATSTDKISDKSNIWLKTEEKDRPNKSGLLGRLAQWLANLCSKKGNKKAEDRARIRRKQSSNLIIFDELSLFLTNAVMHMTKIVRTIPKVVGIDNMRDRLLNMEALTHVDLSFKKIIL